jgi:hypothetical protein
MTAGCWVRRLWLFVGAITNTAGAEFACNIKCCNWLQYFFGFNFEVLAGL